MTTQLLATPAGKNRPLATRGVTPAAGALVLATPVATWWLVGDAPASAASFVPQVEVEGTPDDGGRLGQPALRQREEVAAADQDR
jgi:hypothetical protein